MILRSSFPKLDIALIIPALDEGEALARLISQARSMKVFSQIILVDDGSIKPLLAHGADITLRQNRSRGAGAARNLGLGLVQAEYVLFFDADDELSDDLPLLLRDLAGLADGFDVCVFRHADSRMAQHGYWGEPEHEIALWEETGLGAGALQQAPDKARPVLAQTINYPWNKILRTEFLRHEGIACADTQVHNDIPLHWLALMKAKRVFTSDRICALHHFHEAGSAPRLSDAKGDMRAQMFEALALVAPEIKASGSPQWQDAFSAFALNLACWAEEEKDAAGSEVFQAAKESFFARHLPKQRIFVRDVKAEPSELPAPFVARHSPLRFARIGPQRHRSPLAHASLQPLWSDHLVEVVDLAQADLVLSAHPNDFATAPPGLEDRLEGGRAPKLLLYSEEPLWDLLFSPDPLAQTAQLPVFRAGMRPVRQVNFLNSGRFVFDKIPYFLLTNHRFANAYAARFAVNAKLDATEWAQQFRQRRDPIAFIAARHRGHHHDTVLLDGQIRGLSAWRSRVAERLVASGARLHGQGWSHHSRRSDLRNWHLDKLVGYGRQSVLLSAIENTHFTDYVSEKIFDAFAMGSIPVYLASPNHAIHRLGLPEGSWINLWGLSEDDAVEHLRSFKPDTETIDAFTQAQRQLAAVFASCDALHHDRHKTAQAIVKTLQQTVDGAQAL